MRRIIQQVLVIVAIAAATTCASLIAAPRLFDRFMWPYTGLIVAERGLVAPASIASLGRDCFLQSDASNLIGVTSDKKMQSILQFCSGRENPVYFYTSPNFAKAVSRCAFESSILERSVIVFNGVDQPDNVCTVSLFSLEKDLGVGMMTISSYE